MKLNFRQLVMIALVSIFYLSGCSSSRNLSIWDKYYNRVGKEFSDAYSFFNKGDYKTAKDKFIAYNNSDTAIANFESYAFLAECYKKLGDMDSSKIAYKNGIRKLELLNVKNGKVDFNNNISLDTLKSWYADYPKFPDHLRIENGFVPKDVYPEVTKSVPPDYPVEAKENNIEGEVYVKILVDLNGLPKDFLILKSTNPIFNETSIEAAKEFKFTPLIRKGFPNLSWVVVPFYFRMNR